MKKKSVLNLGLVILVAIFSLLINVSCDNSNSVSNQSNGTYTKEEIQQDNNSEQDNSTTSHKPMYLNNEMDFRSYISNRTFQSLDD